MWVTLYEIGGVHFRLLGANGFHVKAKNERFNCLRCRHNITFEISRRCLANWTKKRAACAARLFYLIQQIKSLISGVIVSVAVVISLETFRSDYEYDYEDRAEKRLRMRAVDSFWCVFDRLINESLVL